jgi:thiamine monophosphate synthase
MTDRKIIDYKREDVIQLAREACDKTKVDAFYNGYWTITQDELERVIHLATQKAVAEEREACALAAEAESLTDGTNDPADVAYNNAVKHCTAAIRARKDNT